MKSAIKEKNPKQQQEKKNSTNSTIKVIRNSDLYFEGLEVNCLTTGGLGYTWQ